MKKQASTQIESKTSKREKEHILHQLFSTENMHLKLVQGYNS